MTTRRLRDADLGVDLPIAEGGTVLRVLAVLAVTLDVVTTTWIVHSPAYVDLNLIVTGLESIWPWGAIAALLAVDLVLLRVCLGRGDWVGTGTAAFLVCGPGSGGVNNLLLFLTGYSVMGVLGGTLAVNVLVPVGAAALGITTAWLLHGRPTTGTQSVETLLENDPQTTPRNGAAALVIAATLGGLLYWLFAALL